MKTLLLDQQAELTLLTLNAPEQGNAYGPTMLQELTDFLQTPPTTQALVIRGAGKHFCTGADLKWIGVSPSTLEQSVAELRLIASFYASLLSFPSPILMEAKGHVRGGGLGLLACADFVVAHQESDFALSEVRWGLVPGIITPMLTQRIGENSFNDLAQTGRVIDVAQARGIGLVQEIGSPQGNFQWNDFLAKAHTRHKLRPYVTEQEFEKYLLMSAQARFKRAKT